MATDGTGLKVLIPGLPKAHNGYIELYRNLSCAVFQYEADKASEHLAGKLKQFCGTLTADAEHRLNAAYASGRVLEAGCNAHGVRKFEDAQAAQPTLAAEGRGFLSAMYALRPALTSSASSATRSSNTVAASSGHLLARRCSDQ